MTIVPRPLPASPGGPLPRRLRRSFLAARGDPSPKLRGRGCLRHIAEETRTPPPQLGEGSDAVARNERTAVRGRGPSRTQTTPCIRPYAAARTRAALGAG